MAGGSRREVRTPVVALLVALLLVALLLMMMMMMMMMLLAVVALLRCGGADVLVLLVWRAVVLVVFGGGGACAAAAAACAALPARVVTSVTDVVSTWCPSTDQRSPPRQPLTTTPAAHHPTRRVLGCGCAAAGVTSEDVVIKSVKEVFFFADI